MSLSTLFHASSLRIHVPPEPISPPPADATQQTRTAWVANVLGVESRKLAFYGVSFLLTNMIVSAVVVLTAFGDVLWPASTDPYRRAARHVCVRQTVGCVHRRRSAVRGGDCVLVAATGQSELRATSPLPSRRVMMSSPSPPSSSFRSPSSPPTSQPSLPHPHHTNRPPSPSHPLPVSYRPRQRGTGSRRRGSGRARRHPQAEAVSRLVRRRRPATSHPRRRIRRHRWDHQRSDAMRGRRACPSGVRPGRPRPRSERRSSSQRCRATGQDGSPYGSSRLQSVRVVYFSQRVSSLVRS